MRFRGVLGWLWLVCAAACGRFDFAATGTVALDAGVADAPAINAQVPQPPVFVQHAFMDASPPVAAAAFDRAVAAGDLIIAAFDYGLPSAASTTAPRAVTDSLGNAYSLVGKTEGPFVDPDFGRQYIAYAISQASGVDTISVTLDGSDAGFIELRLHEYAGVSPSQPFDVAVGAAGTAAGDDAAQTPSITTSEANELLFGLVVTSQTISAGTGFTTRGTDDADLTEDMIAVVPGPYHLVATSTGGDWIATLVAFRGR